VDASFSVELNKIGIGMCIPDKEGVFILTKCIPLPVLHTINVGEALSLFYALE